MIIQFINNHSHTMTLLSSLISNQLMLRMLCLLKSLGKNAWVHLAPLPHTILTQKMHTFNIDTMTEVKHMTLSYEERHILIPRIESWESIFTHWTMLNKLKTPVISLWIMTDNHDYSIKWCYFLYTLVAHWKQRWQ